MKAYTELELLPQPLTVPDILDLAVSLYRRNFRLFLAIGAVVLIPVNLFSTLYQAVATTAIASTASPAGFGSLLGGGFLLQFVGTFLGYSLVSGALSRAIGGRYLGQRVRLGETYRRVLARLPSLIGAAILSTLGIGVMITAGLLIIIPAFSVAGLLSAITTGMSASSAVVGVSTLVILVLGLVFTLVCLLPAVYLYLRWSLFAQIIVLESTGATRALGRSWRLTRGHVSRGLVIVVVLSLLTYTLSTSPSLLLLWLWQVLGLPRAIQPVITGIAQTLVAVALTPLTLGGITLYYYDLRIRKEALDLEIRAYRLSQL